MQVQDWGFLDYQAAWDRQVEIQAEVMDGADDTLVLVEHPSVLTLGANFHQENLLHPVEHYQDQGIDVVVTDRGGDVTYHGPGQLVVYPIFDVSRHGKDLHRWMRELEQCVMQVVAGFGLESRRFPPHTGVWIEDLKVAAIGIKIRRWVSIHGIALNCNNSLAPFSMIVPCGITGYGVTSLSAATGTAVTPDAVKPLMIQAFQSNFGR
ncbi:MAG: lipoyl(octanoyl) transferase LipB [Armatimonadetes bacterium]|nr:lipoyl(octanoyl) transferase LipB [Armatimonadota bacterium]